MLLASFSLLQGCSSEEDSVASITEAQQTTATATAVSFDSDVDAFDVSLDTSAFTEQETIPADDEDYVENTTFTKTVNIVFTESGATWDGDVNDTDLTVTATGAHVVVNSTVSDTVAYTVSGSTSNGSLTVYSDRKFQLRLAGAQITNPSGAPINIQGKKRVFVVLADGTENTLTDGTDYATAKACLFSKGQLIFSGSGRLNVYGNNKAGIRSSDYVVIRPHTNIYVETTAGNGIKGDEALNIYGGVVNVQVSANGAKGLSSDGHVLISGGRTTAIVTGSSVYDSDEADIAGSSCVKADSTFTITGGALYLKNTGKGGKGISVDQQARFYGGATAVITTGSTYKYSSSLDSKSKGVKADGDIVVSGGVLKVRTTGGDGSEGIESKSVMTVTGGSVQAYASDDAINTASHLYIQGGTVYAYSTGNDGIDTNGNLYLQGGNTVAYGSRSPECGIDTNEEGGYTAYFTGGNLFSIGGGNSTPGNSNSTQGYVMASGNVSKGNVVALYSGDNLLTSFSLPASYSNGSILFTANGMTAGNSYTLMLNGTGTSLTAQQYGSSSMGGGGQMGGGPGLGSGFGRR